MDRPLSLFRPAGGGLQRRVLGMRHDERLRPDETGGAFLLFELTVPPGLGAPPHRHGEDAEAFYLLAGRLTFDDGEGSRTAGPGDVCFLPAGGVHAFRNDGPDSARALVVVSPGRAAAGFFAAVDALADADASPEAVARLAARHDLTIVG